jgi:transposase-like protein
VDEFRELLRARLVGRGALARLSKESGIASHILGRWRDGIGRPTDTNLKRLAPALGVDYGQLMQLCGYLPGEVSDEQAELARIRSENQMLKRILANFQKVLAPLTLDSHARIATA